MAESSIKEESRDGVIPQETISESEQSRKIKPRALIFKAQDKDLHRIKELIETQFPEVEIIYVTTGPATSILRVTKSMPFETQNYPAQALYTIE
jgi:hypothetical protein